jgi:light-regulated signal transduction histidine kinase (bacteriophytochrome)
VEKQHVDVTSLVAGVIRTISADRPDTRLPVRVGQLPPCQADSALLKQVFVNLIGNALKYTARCEQPLIDIGATDHDGQIVYFVRDNGIGFDMQYADMLFGVFQRLHGMEEFEGTGVGLAIVHNIITRHGGRIWAEAEVGKGATFYFTL